MTEDVLDTPQAGALVIRGGVLRTVAYVAGTLLSVASAAVLTRELGAADYGRYVAVFSLVTVVGSVSEAGMTTLGVREYSIRQGEDRRALLASLIGLRLVLTAVGVAIAVGFLAVAGYDGEQVTGAALAGAGLLVAVLAFSYGIPLQAELLIGRLSAVELARQALTTVLLVVLVLAGAGIVGLLAVALPVGAAMAVLTAALVRGRTPFLPRFDAAAWMRLLRMTAAFAAAAAVGTIYIYLAVVLMPLVTTDTETGYFGVAFRVFIVVAAIPGLLVNTALPVLARAARDDRERLAYALSRLLQVALVAGAGCALLTAVGAPIAIDVVAGDGYEDAVDTLRVQSLAMIGTFLLATWGYGLISIHAHRPLLVANLLAFCVSLVLVLTLAGPYGATGTAVATVAGETLLAVAYAVALARADERLRPRAPGVWKLAALVAVAGAAAVLPPWGTLPATIVAGLIFGAGVLGLRLLPEELRERLPLPAVLR